MHAGKLPEQVQEVCSLTGSESAEKRLICGQCNRKQTECMMGVKKLLLVSLLALLGKKLPVHSSFIVLMVQMLVVFPALTLECLTASERSRFHRFFH